MPTSKSVFLILLLVLGATQAFDWIAMSQHVEAISAMPESQCALRNLFITDDYQRIGLAFKHLLNVQQGQLGGTHMNWLMALFSVVLIFLASNVCFR